jgi:hypothetical protein
MVPKLQIIDEHATLAAASAAARFAWQAGLTVQRGKGAITKGTTDKFNRNILSH